MEFFDAVYKMTYMPAKRLKLNKNSGANICLDYGFGQNGSSGIFVNIGEVF